MLSRLLAVGIVALLALSFIGRAEAATLDWNWTVVEGDAGFPNGYDTDHGETVGGASAGGFHANANCLTLNAGEIVVVTIARNAPSGTPSGATQTGGTTLTHLYSYQNLNRATVYTDVFYRKIATNGEACAWTFTWPDDLDSLDWSVVNLKPSSGTPAATVIDVSSSPMESYKDGSSNMLVGAISPVNSGDSLMAIYTFYSGPAGPYTMPGIMAKISDSQADGNVGGWGIGTIVIAFQTGIASGTTGTKTGTFSGSFNDQNNALISFNAPSGATSPPHSLLMHGGR